MALPEGGYRQRDFPDWARAERSSDLTWLSENLHVLLPAAQKGFQEFGRGALQIFTTIRPATGGGNPFIYMPEKALEADEDLFDALRFVRKYDPAVEFVAILLKEKNRISAYQLRVPSQKK